MEDQEFVPIFGKGVLPSVSEGMYRDSFFLFREYIQNSADSIDEAIRQGILNKNEAQIEISIDEEERRIVIQDNGVGISKDLAEAYLVNVGDSKKDPKVCKGQFGIGRLGGLGYCGRIIFETSARGEKYKSRVVWDAAQLRELINDIDNDKDAIAVIQLVTKSRTEVCDEDSHYFIVTLEDVSEAHDELLDLDEVRKYLTQAAPVGFDKASFRYADKIYKFLAANKLTLGEYRVNLNNEPVYKCYTDEIENPRIDPERDRNGKGKTFVEIKDVYCRLIVTNRGQIRGWYWVARTDIADAFSKHCFIRGLRLKQWNIQIGDQYCLNELWKEVRGNTYFVGEIHVLDTNLVPNARRDYFRESVECRIFESELRDIFAELNEVYRQRSKIQAQGKNIQKEQDLSDKLNEKERKNAYLDEDERVDDKKSLNSAKAKAEEARKERKKLEDAYLVEDEDKCETVSSSEVKQNDTVFNNSLTREYLGDILRNNPLPELITIQENESKRPTIIIRTVPQTPPRPKVKNWREKNPFDAGEQALLRKIKEVLQEELPTSQFKTIWDKIMNRICGQEEDRDVQ